LVEDYVFKIVFCNSLTQNNYTLLKIFVVSTIKEDFR